MKRTRCFARSGEYSRVLLEIRGGLGGRDPAVEVRARGFVAGIGQLVHESLYFVVLGGFRRVQSGGGKEHGLLERQTLGGREGDLDPVVRGSFGDERLRREERINRELRPAAVAHQVLLEQRVVDVMPRISFVAREVDRAVDINRQIGVDLNQAAEVALVPVVPAPRLVGDVLDREPLVGGQRDVLHRAVAAGLDGGLKDRVELLARD